MQGSNTLTRRKPLLTKRFLLLNSLFALVYSNIAFFYLYPLYLESLGASNTVIGWIMGALPASTVLVRPLMPATIRRFGLHATLGGGLIVIFLSSVGYHVIHHISPAMFALRIVHGLGFSAFVAASFTVAAHIVPQQRRAEAFGYIGALILACVALAPILAEQLINGFGYPVIFHGASGAAFLAMIIVSLFRSWQDSTSDNGAASGILAVLRKKSLLLILTCTLLFVNANATVLTFVALFGKQQGFSGMLFFGTASTFAVLIRIFGAGLMDRHGKKQFVFYSFLLLGAGLFLLTKSASPLVYIFAVSLYGIGLGYLYPGLNALAVDQAAPQERAAVMSLFTGIFDCGFMLGAVLSGFLADALSLTGMFLVVSLSTILGAITVQSRALHESRS